MRRQFKRKHIQKEQYTETDFLKDLAQEVLKGTTTTVDVEDILYGRYSSDAEAEKAIKKFYRVLHNMEEGVSTKMRHRKLRKEDINENSTVMEITIGSGISADGCDIEIKQNGKTVFRESYRYGYNASYNRELAHYAHQDFINAKKYGWENQPLDQPYIGDIIVNLCKKYNVNKENIIIKQGKNVFAGTDVPYGDTIEFINWHLPLLIKGAKGVNESYKRLQEKEDVDIDVKNPGVLEVPEGKSVDSLPVSHFVNLAKKKGTSDVTKALNNLQVWNKKKDPKLSKWAGDMIDKVKQQTEKNECIRPNRTRRSKLKEGKEQTVGQYITQQLDDGKIQEKQVIAFYDKNNNVKWLGKAGYYPIYLDHEPFKSAKKVKNEIRINERGVSESTNMKESPMDYLDSEKRAIIDKLESLGYSGTKPINFGGSVLIMYSKTYWTDKRTSSGLEIYIDPLEGDVTVQEFEHEVDTEDLTDLCPVKYVTSANDVVKIDRWAKQAKKHEYSLNYESIGYDRYDPNVEAQFMDPGDFYDDMPETEYDTDDTFEFYVSYCMNNCGNEEIAREYLESENLPGSFIDSIIDEVYLRFDML